MTPPKRLGAVLALAVATSAVSFSAVPADAAPAGKDYEQIIVRFQAKVEGCKVSVQGGDAFRVFARLDNTDNRRALRRTGSVTVVKNGEFTARGFDTGAVPGGKVSKVKSILVPNKPSIALGIGVGAGEMGDGKVFKLKRIAVC